MRPDWDTYFTWLARTIALRADCYGSHYGAVLVYEHRVVSTGYNGTAQGQRNCSDDGCHRCLQRKNGSIKSGDELDLCACIHAESNAVLYAQLHGFVSFSESHLYVAGNGPYKNLCRRCTELIVNVGIPLAHLNGEIIYAVD